MPGSYARGSVRREGKRWILRRRIEGHEERLTLGDTTELRSSRSARRRADEKLAQLHADGGEMIRLERFAPFFLDTLCAQMKPATRSTYASMFRTALLPALGRQRLDAIGERSAAELMGSMVRAGRAPRTVRLALTTLALALRKASANGYAAKPLNLSALRLGRRLAASAMPRCFTPAETARILGAAAPPWQAFYALMAYAGLRCGEALGLTWGAIDLEAATLSIRQAAYMGRVQATKTEGSEATLHLVAPLVTYLRAHAGAVPPDPQALLFPSRRDLGRPCWSGGVLRTHFHPLLERLGIPSAGFHAFRHSLATNLILAGTQPNVVKEILRHADLRTTLRYTHVTREDQRAGLERFASAMPQRMIGLEFIGASLPESGVSHE